MTTLADFRATAIDGRDTSLADHLGQVVLVVNTASRCGKTPQYEGLQQLHDRHHDRGLTVLGFPCDQFGHQEPGTEAEIAEFCQLSYGVTFPMFAKVEVNGDGAHPLWAWLREQEGDDIEWNFTKFLLGRDGRVVGRYGPQVEPASLSDDVERLLTAGQA